MVLGSSMRVFIHPITILSTLPSGLESELAGTHVFGSARIGIVAIIGIILLT